MFDVIDITWVGVGLNRHFVCRCWVESIRGSLFDRFDVTWVGLWCNRHFVGRRLVESTFRGSESGGIEIPPGENSFCHQ